LAGAIVGLIAAVIVGIAGANIANGDAAILALAVGPVLGIGLCFVPKLRGLGVGLILSIPAGLLLLLGFCAVMAGSGAFR